MRGSYDRHPDRRRRPVEHPGDRADDHGGALVSGCEFANADQPHGALFGDAPDKRHTAEDSLYDMPAQDERDCTDFPLRTDARLKAIEAEMLAARVARLEAALGVAVRGEMTGTADLVQDVTVAPGNQDNRVLPLHRRDPFRWMEETDDRLAAIESAVRRHADVLQTMVLRLRIGE